MYVTWHDPALRVQLVRLKVPVELLMNETVPDGVIAPVPEVSVTSTAQELGLLSGTLAGEQVTDVAVVLVVEASRNVLLLPL